jgi:hypothetical protein
MNTGGLEDGLAQGSMQEIIPRVRRLREHLRRTGTQIPTGSAASVACDEVVAALPDWASGCEALTCGDGVWLLVRPRAQAGPDIRSQVVLRLPAGRYLIDTFDPTTCACVARESASGNPVVAGLPFAGKPVLLWIRAVAEDTATGPG